MRQGQEPGAGQYRHRCVQPARGRNESQGCRHRQPGVDHDLGGYLPFGGDHGQHRNPGGRVVLLVAHGQRPGVRRRPEEDDGEHHQRLPPDGAGGRRPADHHRHAARGSTPHHVLRGAALEQQGVNQYVEGNSCGRQMSRQQIGGPPQPEERRHRKREPEDQRVATRHRRPGQRPTRGALHYLVDVGVGDTVQGVGPAGSQHAPEERVEDQNKIHRTSVGKQHRRDRGHQQQLDNPRFRQRNVAAKCGADPTRPRDSRWAGAVALANVHAINSSRTDCRQPPRIYYRRW